MWWIGEDGDGGVDVMLNGIEWSGMSLLAVFVWLWTY